jgi:uncharacterized protein YodC (DUF2158 family)
VNPKRTARASKEKFVKGDHVREKSSGATMNVAEAYASDMTFRFLCSWSDSAGSIHHRLFEAEQLESFPQLIVDDTKLHASLSDDTTEVRSL